MERGFDLVNIIIIIVNMKMLSLIIGAVSAQTFQSERANLTCFQCGPGSCLDLCINQTLDKVTSIRKSIEAGNCFDAVQKLSV